MDRPTLIQLDRSLDDNADNASQLLRRQRGLYFYYNGPNEATKPLTIHSHICGDCAWGTGKIPNATPGLNGSWVGPFATLEFAENFVRTKLTDIAHQFDQTCTCLQYWRDAH